MARGVREEGRRSGESDQGKLRKLTICLGVFFWVGGGFGKTKLIYVLSKFVWFVSVWCYSNFFF